MNDFTELIQYGIHVQAEVLLKNKTWFGVGGCAEYYFEPKDDQQLKKVLQYAYQKHIPVTMLGSGSNVLIRDGGLKGLVIHLPKTFAQIAVEKDVLVCGAAASLMDIAQIAAKANISGFEFMSGIPGSLGGGLGTNAGAYGSDLGQVAIEAAMLDNEGDVHICYPRQENIFSYRSCKLPTDWICIQAKLQGKLETTNQPILDKMLGYREKRLASQPQGVRTAGSTFKNPLNLSAWKLLDEVGLRGYTLNGAKFSEKHPNFLINTGSATAKDLEKLIILAQEKVFAQKGIKLECEIHIIGENAI